MRSPVDPIVAVPRVVSSTRDECHLLVGHRASSPATERRRRGHPSRVVGMDLLRWTVQWRNNSRILAGHEIARIGSRRDCPGWKLGLAGLARPGKDPRER